MQSRDVDELELFLAERGAPLLSTAKLLTGSREAGEDLLQAALERLLKHRHRIDGDPEGYLRRTLYNLAADGWRRRGTRIGAGAIQVDFRWLPPTTPNVAKLDVTIPPGFTKVKAP